MQEIDGTGDINGDAASYRFPGINAFDLRDGLGILLEQIPDTTQYSFTLSCLHVRPFPFCEGLPGGGHGTIDILYGGGRNMGEFCPGRGFLNGDGFAGRGGQPLAADAHLRCLLQKPAGFFGYTVLVDIVSDLLIHRFFSLNQDNFCS
jgi:hypothetical protein